MLRLKVNKQHSKSIKMSLEEGDYFSADHLGCTWYI